ncbi:hypothetical protein Tco_0901597 [Tanacetum coccineum]
MTSPATLSAATTTIDDAKSISIRIGVEPRTDLSRRNVSLPSLACPLCDHVLEDSSHLFFGCSMAKDIQNKFVMVEFDVHLMSLTKIGSLVQIIRLGFIQRLKRCWKECFNVSWWKPLELQELQNTFLASLFPERAIIRQYCFNALYIGV